jgi:DNA-binding GntR family transcriptional regulator
VLGERLIGELPGTGYATAMRCLAHSRTHIAALCVGLHETLVATCGNETTIVVIGSLEAIWSAHESSVWDEAQRGSEEVPPDSPMASSMRRAALRDHEKILAAIETGKDRGE